ncbi:MAG: exodeoxyribonuclease VII small subunit [Oscillospiraceae bacterium]|nr:exodeoxyribonuclease VII small subunit [Oscillospiraceae bacterium]
MPKSKSKTFEENLTRLEEIVKLLEDGSVPLEESMKLFQEGSALAASCGKLLDQAELEIVKLTKAPEGGLQEVPFADESAT